MSLTRATLRRVVASTRADLLPLPATAAGKTLVGTPGKDRLKGGQSGNVINGDGGGDVITRDAARIDYGPGNDLVQTGYNRRIRTTRCEKVTRRYERG